MDENDLEVQQHPRHVIIVKIQYKSTLLISYDIYNRTSVPVKLEIITVTNQK